MDLFRAAARARRRLLWALAALCAVCAPAHAARVAVITSGSNKIHALITAGIHAQVKFSAREFSLTEHADTIDEDLRRFDPQAVIAVGNESAVWAKENYEDAPLILSGVIRQRLPESLQSTPGVSLEFRWGRYVEIVREALPDIRVIGVIYSPSREADDIRGLTEAAAQAGMKAVFETAEEEKEISRAIRSLHQKGAEMLLLTYNPLVMGRESFQYLVEYCFQNKISLAVPAKSLLKLGGTLSIEPNYTAIGAQTAAIAAKVLEGGNGGRLQGAEQSEVGVNLKAAGILNLKVSESALHRMSYIYR